MRSPIRRPGGDYAGGNPPRSERRPGLLDRQALHAHRLRVAHPQNGALLEFEAPLPPDIRGVLDELRLYRRTNS